MQGVFMKKFILVFGIMLTGFITLSCYTSAAVFDDSIPQEQSANILFQSFKPSSYNGITVDWSKSWYVTVPAGMSEFSGDINWSQYSTNAFGKTMHYSFNEDNAAVRFHLEAGEDYKANVGYKTVDDVKVWGIWLYKDKIKAVDKAWPSDDALIDFFPFNPQVLSS